MAAWSVVFVGEAVVFSRGDEVRAPWLLDLFVGLAAIGLLVAIVALIRALVLFALSAIARLR
jgi:hypothetical protein